MHFLWLLCKMSFFFFVFHHVDKTDFFVDLQLILAKQCEY